MTDFLTRLQKGEVLLGDGAMGTELQKRGLPDGACPEEFNISHPDVVMGIYQSYFQAGSNIIETNTFGGNRSRLNMHDYAHRVAEFNIAGAQLAKQVCPDGCFVAGSIGPTGDIIEPLGPRTIRDAEDIFIEQAEALAEGGVDVIYVETMMAPEEAEIAIKSAKKTGLPVVATMSFEAGKAGLRTMWGVTVEQAVERLTDAGADLVGANCGKGYNEMIAIMQEMRPLTNLPIIAQSNAGIPEWVNGVSVYKETPELVKPKAEQLLQIGVNILGGCCGTNPDFVKMQRLLVDEANSKRAS